MKQDSCRLFAAAALSILASGALQLQAGPYPVWVKTSLERVGISDSAGPVTQASISAAKGETESFQIIVQGPSGGLTNGNVILSDLVSATGQVISQSNYTLYAERYVNVSPGSVNWNGTNQPLPPGLYPDPLIPFKDPKTGASLNGIYKAAQFSLNSGANQPIWVDLTVPRTAAAGQYSGTITITANSGNVVVPVNVKVWNFAIPVNPSQSSSFAFWNQTTPDWSFELLKHRVMPEVSSCAGLVNSPGLLAAGCLGNAATDAALMASGDTMSDLRFWSGAYHSNCAMPPAPSVAAIQQVVASHQPGMMLYNYSVDEAYICPNLSSLFPAITQWGNNLHAAGVLNLMNTPPIPALLDDGTGRPVVDIWGVQPVTWGPAAAAIAQAKQAGSKIWIYSELVQDGFSPKWEIDFAPVNFRIVPGFINQSLGIEGLLYFRCDAWTSDPWNQVNNVGMYSTNDYPGDGVLVYPGDQVGIPGGVVPSMRLKYIRDGMDDYDYIDILKKLGQGAWATSVANSVGPDWTNWTRDINAVYAARTQLGDKIEQLMNISANPAPVVVSAAPVSGNGPSSAFTFTFGSGSGASNLSWVNVLFSGNGVDGRNACWLAVNVASNTMWLAQDNGGGWNPAGIGSGAPLQNSQCSIASAGSSVAIAGSTLSLTLPVSFTPKFSGQKNVYLLAADYQGNSTGYQQFASWLVIPPGPGVVSVTPSTGAGSGQTFQVTLSDSNGAAALNTVNFVVGQSPSPISSCSVSYNPASNLLFLQWDNAQGAQAASIGEQAYVLSNSQCTVNPRLSSLTRVGNLFTLNLAITFNHGFAGTQTVFVQTADSSANTGYQSVATYAVQ